LIGAEAEAPRADHARIVHLSGVRSAAPFRGTVQALRRADRILAPRI
jgi:hypothetical protein